MIKTQRKKETETQRRGNKDPKREEERFREKEMKTKTQRDGEIETQRKGVRNSKEKGRQRPRVGDGDGGVCQAPREGQTPEFGARPEHPRER